MKGYASMPGFTIVRLRGLAAWFLKCRPNLGYCQLLALSWEAGKKFPRPLQQASYKNPNQLELRALKA